jgi:MFS family permease
MFWLFALLRGLVGIGEASYSCVAPTIIGDLYKGNMRTIMLAIFNLAIPVGCGMGYICGSAIASLFGNWVWALRCTPALGLICVSLLIFLVEEPARGAAEGMAVKSSHNSFRSDILYLLKKFVKLRV